ncbi:Ig-like domain-containing protein, partial [Planctomycetota bacterium]
MSRRKKNLNKQASRSVKSLFTRKQDVLRQKKRRKVQFETMEPRAMMHGVGLGVCDYAGDGCVDDHYIAAEVARTRIELGNARATESLSARDQEPGNIVSAQGDDTLWKDYGVGDTFKLHSKPGAAKTIYLDFDGHVTRGTPWNFSYNNGRDIDSPGFYKGHDNSDHFGLSPTELIRDVWRIVSEDYAAFDINVTTEEPGEEALKKSGSNDNQYGMRVVFGDDTFLNPGRGGGVGYVSSFDNSSDTPVFVFGIGGSSVAMAALATHEVGHSLGLRHHGAPGQTYYAGHGSGATEWGPHMGFGRTVAQWSNGDYPGATNSQQDDLKVITTQNGFGYRADDYGDSMSNASMINVTASNSLQATYGIIERNTDVDMFAFDANPGRLTISVDPYFRDPSLDIGIQLLDSQGRVISEDIVNKRLDASITADLDSSGRYYVSVTGTGYDDPHSPGYTDYGSLGNYRVIVESDSGGVTPPPSNTAPVAHNDSASTNENQSIVISVLGNDRDADGDALNIVSATDGDNGMTMVNADGTITYTPDANFSGTDSFTYTIS